MALIFCYYTDDTVVTIWITVRQTRASWVIWIQASLLLSQDTKHSPQWLLDGALLVSRVWHSAIVNAGPLLPWQLAQQVCPIEPEASKEMSMHTNSSRAVCPPCHTLPHRWIQGIPHWVGALALHEMKLSIKQKRGGHTAPVSTIPSGGLWVGAVQWILFLSLTPTLPDSIRDQWTSALEARPVLRPGLPSILILASLRTGRSSLQPVARDWDRERERAGLQADWGSNTAAGNGGTALSLSA